MGLHRAAGQEQVGRDVGVRAPVCHQVCDEAFGGGQRVPSVAAPGAGGPGTSHDPVRAQACSCPPYVPGDAECVVHLQRLPEGRPGGLDVAAAGQQHGRVLECLPQLGTPTDAPVVPGGVQHRARVTAEHAAAPVGCGLPARRGHPGGVGGAGLGRHPCGVHIVECDSKADEIGQEQVSLGVRVPGIEQHDEHREGVRRAAGAFGRHRPGGEQRHAVRPRCWGVGRLVRRRREMTLGCGPVVTADRDERG